MAVRIAETGELFATLSEAIAAAQSAGLTTFTLIVIDDITETSNVIITSNVTISGSMGEHVVTMNNPAAQRFLVDGGGSLTLGGGTATDNLTILSAVSVTNGSINLRNGIALSYNGTAALLMSGPNASGTISGGTITGGAAALSMANGAQLNEISGGTFFGVEDAILLSGVGTRIDIISNGAFYQTDPNVTLHGHSVFVDDSSEIGLISGGYFEAVRSNALAITRGGWVNEISGGEFVATRVGSGSDRNSAVRIEGATALTGIGTISGGYFHGSYFGILVVRRDFRAQIGRITGGRFEGVVAIQNDIGCFIIEISGGTVTGSQGMLNNGTIETIGGNVEIHGIAASGGYGIYNYTNGQIDEISGGTIISDNNNAIMNQGGITLISGGTIIGGLSAISSTGIVLGRIGTISGGVFLGRNAVAISLAYNVVLEPGLSSIMGAARFSGRDGVIFNNESLVIYPYNSVYDAYYKISTETVPVVGIPDVEFRYLVLDVDFFTVTFLNWDGSVLSVQQVPIGGSASAPTVPPRPGYIFTGWDRPFTNVQADIIVTALFEPVEIIPAQAEIRAKKVVCGACIQAGMFTFAVYDQHGNEITQAANDSQGDIVFVLDTLTQAGTYAYTVRELSSPTCGWVTDSRCHLAIITVTMDNDIGQLTAHVRYPNGSIVFVNYYCS